MRPGYPPWLFTYGHGRWSARHRTLAIPAKAGIQRDIEQREPGYRVFVIPAKAGIQGNFEQRNPGHWMSFAACGSGSPLHSVRDDGLVDSRR